ncbi:L,D-transpeptidase family protein [uncultured Bartonella sp.]|uniref:L,D-transpeptidase family protein n=1 Tax=uncultured Bartonella sp. TaxID=104108 RepID=UPI00262BFB19|nr:L,D-transpeptidase family protein [uncultured Bartonella sp.]
MQVPLTRNSIKIPHFVSFIAVRRRCGTKSQGILAIGQYRFLCALGKNGFSARKREGDGATPIGVMPILGGFQKNSRHMLPRHILNLHRLNFRDGWCDSVGDANYNRPVRLPYKNSAEKLGRRDALYDIVLIPDWNICRRAQNRGSAIFIHLARPQFTPTEGCVACSRRTMERILPYISRKTKLVTFG